MNSRQDGPHGVGGWLALLVAGMLVIGPLLGIGRTYGEFASAEHQYPVLAQVAEWSSYKTAKWIALLLFCAISIYGGLGLATNRTPDAVPRAKLVLWFNYPISIVVIWMIIPAAMIPDSGKDVAMAIPSLIASLIAVGIWTAYLNRSKRVKNTYGITNMTLAPEKVNTGSPISEDSSRIAPRSQSTTQQQTAVDEERIYTVIANELETGAVDKGLWTRLFAECGGDEKQTKVLYIKQRAERLISAERSRLAQTERKRVEAERLEQLNSGLADPLQQSTKEAASEVYGHEEAIRKARFVFRDPIHIDVYAKKYGVTLDQTMKLIGEGRLKGYEWGKFLFVEDIPVHVPSPD